MVCLHIGHDVVFEASIACSKHSAQNTCKQSVTIGFSKLSIKQIGHCSVPSSIFFNCVFNVLIRSFRNLISTLQSSILFCPTLDFESLFDSSYTSSAFLSFNFFFSEDNTTSARLSFTCPPIALIALSISPALIIFFIAGVTKSETIFISCDCSHL